MKICDVHITNLQLLLKSQFSYYAIAIYIAFFNLHGNLHNIYNLSFDK